ncbi:L-xylulose reductase-like [Oppia nitens]|uniref:L-xylulose reductase-like n=1 Tax=Oppia nitens TaxID=1686743 RepID=UPI0023DBA08D|nr:L-xylulose reductase-like [Oppia nitens]
MEIALTAKRVLITGACGGIGKALIKKVIDCKGFVIALDVRSDQLRLLNEEFVGNIETICVDLNDWNAVIKALNCISRIDLLVNSAGICLLESVGAVTQQAVDRQLSLNVNALINISQTVAQQWIKTKTKGVIVNISSQSSMRALKDHVVYCATKGAVDQITRVMALELAQHHIRVNAVNPTVVWTDLAKIVWADPVVSGAMKSRIPMGRFAEPEEVADAVVFLLSERSSMITGVTLPVDGGFLAT